MSTEIIIAIVGIVTIIVKIFDKLFDFFIEWIKKDKQDKIDNNATEVYDLTKKMYDMHNKMDSNGLPIWYTPRSIETSISNISNCISDIEHSEEAFAKSLDKVAQILDNLSRDQAEILFFLRDKK